MVTFIMICLIMIRKQCNTLVTFVHSVCYDWVLINDRSTVHEPFLLLELWRCLRISIWILLCSLKTHITFISSINTVYFIIIRIIMLNMKCEMNGKLRTSQNASMNQLYYMLNVNCQCASQTLLSFVKFWHFPRAKKCVKNIMLFENFLIERCKLLLSMYISKIFHNEAFLKILVVIQKSVLRAQKTTWVCLLCHDYRALSRSSLFMESVPFKCVSPYFRFENINATNITELIQKHFLSRFYRMQPLMINGICNTRLADRRGNAKSTKNTVEKHFLDVFLHRCQKFRNYTFIMIMIYMLPNG